MVDYYELATTDLSSLNAVATDFGTLVRGWDLGESYAGEVLGPLQSSDWSGPSAQAAVTQLTTTRTQIDEAFTEATALAAALRDAHDQFAAAQKQLHAIQQDAAAQGLTIDASGDVHCPPPANRLEERDPDYFSSFSDLASGIADRISAALSQATEADTMAAAALAGDTGTSATSFNGSPVGGIPEEEALQAAALARQGSDLTDAQVERLDQLLKAGSSDPRFATAFYQDLGPKESLMFWGQLSESATSDEGISAARLAALTDMQKNLGLTLATATRTTNVPHLSDAWEAQLRAVGDQQIQLTGDIGQTGFAPYGYQILSNILRTGNYDPHFLDPIAENITQLTEANPTLWVSNVPPMGPGDTRLNLLGGTSAGAGFDPLTGVLDGLGHSPAAATAFFHNPETLYGPNGVPTGKTAPNGYLSFLTNTSKHPQYPDSSVNNLAIRRESVDAEPTALGNALQAATTGVPYDAAKGTPIPQHTAAMGDVMASVVHTFGSDPSLIDSSSAPFNALNKSLGAMTASYIGDVDRSIPSGNPTAAVFGTPANLNIPKFPGNLTDYLDALGRDPTAYSIVTQAQLGYMKAQINQAAAQNANSSTLAEAISNVALPAASVNGILGSARAQQVFINGAAKAQQYNNTVQQNGQYAQDAYSLVESEVKKVPFVGYLLSNNIQQQITDITNGFTIDTYDPAVQQASGINDALVTATNNAATSSTYSALRNIGFSAKNSANIATGIGESAGATYGSSQATNAANQGYYASKDVN